MCMFASPVDVVSKTNIFVSQVGGRQFTAYQMSVSLPSDKVSANSYDDRMNAIINNLPFSKARGNAMILPVPWVKGEPEIELVDMSKATSFFSDLVDLQPSNRTRSLGYSSGQYSADHLVVQKIGKYSVSVAYSVADISRANKDVFTLSDDVQNTLNKHYSMGFAFVICAISVGGDIHPLGYISQARPFLFIPTRHEHGHSDNKEMADWDHTIFAASNDSTSVKDLEAPRDSINGRLGSGTTYFYAGLEPSYMTQEVWRPIVAAVPQLAEFSSAGPVCRYSCRGRLRNTDFIVDSI